MRFGLLNRWICLALLTALGNAVSAVGSPLSWLSPESRRIEAERQSLQKNLAALPPAPPPQVTQRLGWHSDYSASPDTVEWAELLLSQPEPIDAIVLIAPPPSGGATESGYGFPLRFRVELLGDDEKPWRTIIADYTHSDFPNPGMLPVVIPSGGQRAAKIRITATRLFSENQRYFFALGEVMLLQGSRNLGAAIEVAGPVAVHASSSQGTRPEWGRINLVDGHTVLGPPIGQQPSPTLGFRSLPISESRAQAHPWVSLDLGSAQPIDEVRLFPAHPPQFAHSPGYGFPIRYQIDLRENADSEPVIVTAPQSGNYRAPPGDNLVTIVTPGRVARIVRLDVIESQVSNGSGVLALAEMQVWSGGKNIAVGQPVTASDFTEKNGWSRPALVDGFTSAADIVDWPMWLAGLSQRREVEHQLASLESRQSALLQQWRRAGWIALIGMVAAGIVFGVAWSLRARRARQQELEALRQRIARDLHDEIGSSLGSIALITQDILASGNDPVQLREDLREIKEIADETVTAMRDITRLVQSDRYGTGDLASLLRETAARMLHGIPHTLAIEGDSQALQLPVDRQCDLILMFKETLHNVTRHAAATSVEIALAQTNAQLLLTIRDNGRGIDPSAPQTGGMGLTNLQRRASKHGGSVVVTSVLSQGTTVCITLPTHA